MIHPKKQPLIPTTPVKNGASLIKMKRKIPIIILSLPRKFRSTNPSYDQPRPWQQTWPTKVCGRRLLQLRVFGPS
jgi:hypothetical protein